MSLAACPSIPDAALPADVRNGTGAGQPTRPRSASSTSCSASSSRRWSPRTPASGDAPDGGADHRRRVARRSSSAGGLGLARQLCPDDAGAAREPDARGRAARPPRRADRLRAAACSSSCSPRATPSAPATSRRCSPASPRSRPRWAAAARWSSDRARCCSAPAPRSASPPPRHARAPLRARSPPAPPPLARERSAELRGLLAEIAREHGINRALMRQELAFLSHLTRLIGADPETGYRPPGAPAERRRRRPPAHRALDLQA